MGAENTIQGVSNVVVNVSKSDVHKAVRNILANEMSLDTVKIKEEIVQKSHELIHNEVIKHINNKGYGGAGLEDWARRSMDARMKDVDKILKEVVRELVAEHISKECVQVVGAIIEKGLEINVGWNRKVKLSIKEDKITQ